LPYQLLPYQLDALKIRKMNHSAPQHPFLAFSWYRTQPDFDGIRPAGQKISRVSAVLSTPVPSVLCLPHDLSMLVAGKLRILPRKAT
jgi:hypothetical protein